MLNAADWAEEAVRDELRGYLLEHLKDEQSVLVIDETGFIKKAKVGRRGPQYSGTAGRRENSQIGVFLLYASLKGAAFIDRELYLSEEWTADRVRCRGAGIPTRSSPRRKAITAWLGVDVAKAKVDVVLLNEQRSSYRVFANTIAGFEQLCHWHKPRAGLAGPCLLRSHRQLF
jgi:hypothetical protein